MIELHDDRWRTVLAAARGRSLSISIAEASDRLGYSSYSRKQIAEAAAHFATADDLGVPSFRDAATWISVIDSYSQIGDLPRAHRSVAAATAQIDREREPGAAADLHEARGSLLAREGDFAAAYRELNEANALRRRRDATRESMPLGRIAAHPSPRDAETAAELAAVRSALREAELERSQLRQRQVAGVATVAALLASLLGLAYAYKRRTAAALAAERDSAELRADRSHWQMLRYQLNPHFLFNALSSLSGLIVTNPAAAGRVIERLSEFCQLALRDANEELRTLAREIEVLRAYLDVELAGAGEDLTVAYAIEPATLHCLVPPLLLQPLVENALKYGAQTSEERLDLVITVRAPESGRLEIEIANTGRWIEPGRTPRNREAVGLANVRDRLARLGQSADLTFSHDGHWVRARLRLPAREARPGPPTP